MLSSPQVIMPAVIEQAAEVVFSSFEKRFATRLNGRQERALKLALSGQVRHKAARIFSVREEDHAFLVDLARGFCSCPDGRKGHVCEHRIAAYLIEQSMKAIRPSRETSTLPEEEALEKARFVLQARSETLQEAIVYAAIQHGDDLLPVEVIKLEGGTAVVRALPKIKGGELVPRFPFEGRRSGTQVLAGSLMDITIFR